MGDDTHGLWTVEDCAVRTFFLLPYMTFSIPLLTLLSVLLSRLTYLTFVIYSVGKI